MSPQELSPHDRSDLVWFCRRLAAALQGQSSLLVALDTMSEEATPARQGLITAARSPLVQGETLSAALRSRGFPSFVPQAVHAGEASNRLPEMLTRLADRLEVEHALPEPASRTDSYARAFGRLGLLLSCGVPILTALESAAESVADPEVTEVLAAVGAAVSEGVGMAEALARLAPDLPPLTTEMIGDGEEDGRLDFALSVVADYLVDQAGGPAPGSPSQEVSHG